MFALYRKTEKAEPMAHLWAEFLQASQSARDHIGVDALGSMLSQEEEAAINLKNNAHIFPILITSKGGLRSKDNLAASNDNAQRGLLDESKSAPPQLRAPLSGAVRLA